MDRNTTIGLVLIFAVLMVFSYINRPSEKQIEAAKQRRDSIELVKKEMEQLMASQEKEAAQFPVLGSKDSLAPEDVANQMVDLWGDLGISALGNEELITLENNLMKVVVSTKG